MSKEKTIKYLTNAFSPSMLSLPAVVQFKETTLEEFCQAVTVAQNAIGHKGTVDLVNELCGSNIGVNRVQIKTQPGDELYVFMLSLRLEEGKILSKEELKQLLEQGKIKFVKAKVIDHKIISDLIKCKGVCDERTYDNLISELTGE